MKRDEYLEEIQSILRKYKMEHLTIEFNFWGKNDYHLFYRFRYLSRDWQDMAFIKRGSLSELFPVYEKLLEKNLARIEKTETNMTRLKALTVETKRMIELLPEIKKEMIIPLFSLMKDDEEKLNPIPDAPGSDLPCYNTLSDKYKKLIKSARKEPIGWVITWDVDNNDLLACANCGAVAPLEVKRCPACGIIFDD